MIDLANERRIGLHEAAKLYPSFRNGRPTHVSTLLRHITKGVRLANGDVVRLDGARLGGRWITSIEAVQRFMERLTDGAIGDAASAVARTIRTSRQRRRELDRVERELTGSGL
jgi:Protein of unknown function (DUF1580)